MYDIMIYTCIVHVHTANKLHVNMLHNYKCYHVQSWLVPAWSALDLVLLTARAGRISYIIELSVCVVSIGFGATDSQGWAYIIELSVFMVCIGFGATDSQGRGYINELSVCVVCMGFGATDGQGRGYINELSVYMDILWWRLECAAVYTLC